MTECMETCQKYEKARAPELRKLDDMHRVLHKIADAVYLPGTAVQFPRAISGSVWMSITRIDETEHEHEPEPEPEPESEHEHVHRHELEGRWVDWYTKESITSELYDGISGKLGKRSLLSYNFTSIVCMSVFLLPTIVESIKKLSRNNQLFLSLNFLCQS